MVLIRILFPGPKALSLAVILFSVTGVLKSVVPLSSRAIGLVGRLVGVLVDVRVGITVGVFVGICVAVGVVVGVSVAVCVGEAVAVGVFVGVSVGVCVGVDVAVGVSVGVFVGVLVGVCVAVGVSVGVVVGVRTFTVSEPVLLVSLLSWTLLSGSTMAVLGRFPPAVDATLNVILKEALAARETEPLAMQAKAVPVIEQLIVPAGGVLPFVAVRAPCG
jgi:hypothetical protein